MTILRSNLDMKEFVWQHIEFVDGGNSYICFTEKEFDRIRKKYNLVKITDNFWLAKGGIEHENNMHNSCADE